MYSYTYKEGTKVRTHYNKGIEWAQMYNERPSYTTIHKGTNMRLNTQKHSSVVIITSLLQSLSVANEQQTGTESPNTRHISYCSYSVILVTHKKGNSGNQCPVSLQTANRHRKLLPNIHMCMTA